MSAPKPNATDLNKELQKLYHGENAKRFLAEFRCIWQKEAPGLVPYGIISEEHYDTENGILIVMKEADDWSAADFAAGTTYPEFVQDVISGANRNTNMQVWYNLGRWITAVRYPKKSAEEIAGMYEEALQALSTAAITNLNKATGGARSDAAKLTRLAKGAATELLIEEIKVLKPKVILFCWAGLWKDLWMFEDTFLEEQRRAGCAVLNVWHPLAPKSTVGMIGEVRRQWNEEMRRSCAAGPAHR